jgi:UDP-2,4-diacetamido-2,4,6-trideoxy-beta-L-altropyranose hydrolase
MRVAFRVDSSNAIGTGHLMRCLSLAEELRAQGAEILFVMRDLPGASLGRPEAAGFACRVLPPPAGSAQPGDLPHSAWLAVAQDTDAQQTLDALRGSFDWVVVDHYALDRFWHLIVRESASRIMVIDDIADRHHDCELLLDQNLQNASDRYKGLVPQTGRILLGPRYALLRGRFTALRPEALQRPGGKLERVLVFLGGVDAAGATLFSLQGIEAAELDCLAIDVVVGPANPDLAEIRKWCGGRANTRLHEGGGELADLMLSADLSIGAAGGTAWERCCLGLPTILITIARNQQEGARALHAAGAAVWLGDIAEVELQQLAAVLKRFQAHPDRLQPLSVAAASLVDGDGCKRVVRAMLAAEVEVRAAEASDCDRVWSWRNDPDTRKWSNDQRSIAVEDHRNWFAGALNDEQRMLLIGQDARGSVGFVRFDLAGTEAAVSIFLAPARRGEGLGRNLLAQAIRRLTVDQPLTSTVRAQVVSGNLASIRLFESLGFSRSGENFSLAIKGDAQ